MTIKERSIPHIFRNKYLRDQTSSIQTKSISSGGVSVDGKYLPATLSQNGYIVPHYVTFQENTTDTEGNEVIKNLLEITTNGIKVNGSIIATGEVTAYGSGESGGSTTVGNVTIYDGLDSSATDVALSANQGRILKELMTSSGGGGSISTLTDVTLTNLEDGQILKYDATLGYWVNGDGTKVTWENIEGKPEGLTDEKLQQIIDFKADNYLLKSVWDSVFTIDSSGNLRVKPNLVGEKEISAYGSGTSSGGGSGVTVYDGLDSTSTDVALSANQGRILRELIDSIEIGDIDLSDYYTKTQVDNLLDDINLSGYYSKTEIDNLLAGYTSITSFNDHTGDTTKHITATERTNWNKAYTNNHTHSNKSVLDGITSTKVSNWDGVVTNWNKAFYYDTDGNLKVKVNVIGEKEISAYGAGSSSGSGGSITIVDGLTSTATDAALSANQGRILRELIENTTIGEIDLSNYYTKTQVDDLLDDIDTSWSNISGKPTFATVATSGSYNDLSNKPTIPTNTNQLTNGAGYITGITKSMVTTALGYTPPTTNTTYSAGTGLKLSGTTFSADGSAIINSLGEGTSAAERTDYIVAQYAGGGTTTTSYHRRSLANVFAALTKSDITTALGYTPPTTNTTYSAGTGLSLSGTSFSVKYGTAARTACQGNDSRLSDSRPASDVYSWAKAASKPSYSWSEITSKPSFATVATSGKYSDLSGKPTIPTNNNQLTNGAGYITSSGSISGNAATATKLATARTLWGQSFNGTANVGGTITGSYFKINDTSTNPYLKLTQGSNWYIQGYSGYLYLGAGSTKSLRIDSSGNCLSVGEVTAHSDKRLKTDIKPLEVRGELNPVTYVKDGKESIGFIADEVKEVYPELVVTDESTDEKYLSLNYAQLTAVLYAEIKELKNQIRELNEKVRTMAN